MNKNLYLHNNIFYDTFFDKNDLECASEGAITQTSQRIVKAVIKNFSASLSKGHSKLGLDIAKTKGDITKLAEYRNAKISLDALVSMSKGGGYCAGVVLDLENIMKWIIKNRETFQNAYKHKREVIAAFYVSAASILIIGINYAILTLTNVASGDVSWNKNASTRLLDKPYFKSVRELSERINNGSIKSAISAGEKDEVSNESVSAVVGIILATVAGVLILIYFIRFIIMLFLDMRVKISDWLKSESYFAKVVANNNANLSAKQQKEQLEYAKKLEDLAKDIDVDLTDDEDNLQKAVQADRAALRREISIAEKQESFPNSKTAVGGNVSALNF